MKIDINAFVSYLKRPPAETGGDLIWKSFLLMEQNNVDYRFRQPYINLYIKEFLTENGYDKLDITIDDEREIVSALRDVVRKCAGLSPLNNYQKANWQYDSLNFDSAKVSDTTHRSTGEIDDADIEMMSDDVMSNYPDIAKAIKVFTRFNNNIVKSSNYYVDTLWLSYWLLNYISSTGYVTDPAGQNTLALSVFRTLAEK